MVEYEVKNNCGNCGTTTPHWFGLRSDQLSILLRRLNQYLIIEHLFLREQTNDNSLHVRNLLDVGGGCAMKHNEP